MREDIYRCGVLKCKLCFWAISTVLFFVIVQAERPGAGNQGHHAWAPAASVAHHLDAPEPANAHAC